MGIYYGAQMVYGFEPTKEELTSVKANLSEEDLENYVHYIDGYSRQEEENILIGIVKNPCDAGYYQPVEFTISSKNYEHLHNIAKAAGIRRSPQWYIAATML